MGIPAPSGVGASGLPPAGDQANAVVQGVLAAVGPSKPFALFGPMNLAAYASKVTTLTTTNASGAATVADGTGIAPGTAINSVNVPKGTTWATFAGTAGTLALPTLSLWGKPNTSQPQLFDLPSTAGLLGAAVSGLGIPAATTVQEIIRAAVTPSLNSPGVTGIVRLNNQPTAPTPQDLRTPYEFALTNNAVTTGADAAAIFTGAGITYTGSFQIERSFDGGATYLVCNIGGGGQLAVFAAGTPVQVTFGEPEKQVLYRINVTALSAGNINYRFSENGGAAMSLALGSPI